MSVFFTTSADKCLVNTTKKSFKKPSKTAYTLVVTLSDGISHVEIQRTDATTSTTTAVIITTTSAIPVYYGDVVKLTPTILPNYTLTGTWPQTLTIVENAAVAISAQANITQLTAPILTNGGYTTSSPASIYVDVTNPNPTSVVIQSELYDVSKNDTIQIDCSEGPLCLASNNTGQLLFRDSNNRFNMSDWAHAAFIAVRCLPTENVDNSYTPSQYKFYTTYSGFDLTMENTCNGKIPAPTIQASYDYSGGTYTIYLGVLCKWHFPVRACIATPNGWVEVEDDSFNWYTTASTHTVVGSTSFTVNSLDAEVDVYLEDMSHFGFESSGLTTFDLTDATERS